MNSEQNKKEREISCVSLSPLLLFFHFYWDTGGLTIACSVQFKIIACRICHRDPKVMLPLA
ncbi:hypothetical protein BH24ACI1_BH24ACI1_09240 [soil metagenome]